MNKGLSPSRQMWNRVMTALVWASAVLVMVLVAGIIGMVLVRGIPHISWKFLSTTASVLKKTDGILPAILNYHIIIFFNRRHLLSFFLNYLKSNPAHWKNAALPLLQFFPTRQKNAAFAFFQ